MTAVAHGPASSASTPRGRRADDTTGSAPGPGIGRDRRISDLGGVPGAVSALTARIAADPGAPLLAGVTGVGGTGKTAALAAVRATYRAAGQPVTTVRGGSATLPAPAGSPTTSTGTTGAADGPPAEDRAVVLVDDAHLLPDDVLAGLLTRAEQPGARLVVAYRGWPRRPALEELGHELRLGSATIELGPLDRPLVAARASALLGRPAPALLVDHVLRATGGVPRLVDLMLAGTAGAGMHTVGPRATVPLPWDLVGRLDDDLGPADGPLRAVVLALALGTEPDAGCLAAALDLAPARVGELLQESRAAGLVRADGTLVPVVRQVALSATPTPRTHAVLAGLIAADQARGVGAVQAARRVGGLRLRSPELATLLERAGDEARRTDPAQSASFYAAAVDAGATSASLVVRRAECEALAGDLDAALRLADGVLAGPASAHTAEAVHVSASAFAHRGMLRRSAELYAWLGAGSGTTAALEPLAVIGAGLAASGSQPLPAADRSADPEAPPTAGPAAGPADRAPTLRAGAERLLVRGLRDSLDGDGSAALATLGQASALLRSAGGDVLMPDTPEALAALAALSGGEPAHAERVLDGALESGAGGPVARPRHHLLRAWGAMLAGRFDAARADLDQAVRAGGHLEPRDRLFHGALEIGIARRTSDLPGLVRLWPQAREALLGLEVDLFTLLPLGEIAVAAARLDQSHRLAGPLQQARELLARTGEPVLWATPMHWYGVHAAILAERPQDLEPHATALVRGAQVSRYAALLAEAGKVWMQVLAGKVDAAAVERTGRRLHAVGLAWDGSRLAGHAAARTTDQRTMSQLMQLARDLHRSGPPAERPEPTASGPRPSTGSRMHAVQAEPSEATIHLTERELEVAHLVLAGLTYREISERLYISAKTVEHHVARMRQRLGLDSRAALLAHLRARLTSPTA